ncbi:MULTISPECIES: photosystem II assembly protein Psb35 [Cyanophyceae]|uniref:photosystem II assembly protein Psb35 n=1 Tax=Cyanophyceae TaxID=3028117 RepID=UPI00016DC40D|nr:MULTISPECIES: hypothetical protein [Cyanophyceae]ACA99209.1 conserved hypothetical protein [Picosynechococcus sp. PCC 7002]QCS49778.1 hypothetical protein FEK30_10180 [Picosynechococcus sp. PCC 11901]SMH33815.1 hypothetical protein SAMN06272755_0496 [Picosynechococcus sp. OG1]SMQ84468.1 hypothetical protein SAMN06272774_2872 [Synechococcus sp. 7002]
MSDSHSLFLAVAGQPFPLYFTLVYVVGFVAAVSIGLIAFFNSKRPSGWEDAKRPDLIPDLQKKESQDQS